MCSNLNTARQRDLKIDEMHMQFPTQTGISYSMHWVVQCTQLDVTSDPWHQNGVPYKVDIFKSQ